MARDSMRVLHVTHQYPPAIGGAEKYIADVSEELARRGHVVHVYTSRSRDYATWANELAGFERRNGVDVYRFRSLPRGKATWQLLHLGVNGYRRTGSQLYEFLTFVGSGPLCPGLFWRMMRSSHRYDIVHLSCIVYSHVAYGFAAARRSGIPVVVTPHAHLEEPQTYDMSYMWHVLRQSDHVLAQTMGERSFFVRSGLAPQNVTTGGVGLPAKEPPPADSERSRRRLGLSGDDFVVLFLGRKTRSKGLDVVLQAHAALKRHYPQLRLALAGPGTEFSETLLARYGDVPGVVDYGMVSDEMKRDLLGACDCLALPSTGEAFGYVFLEAWSFGKPVIGVETEAVSTVVDHGRDGFLIRPRCASELAESIVHLVEDPDLRHRMGSRGQEKVRRRYTISRVTDVVEGVYDRVLRQRRRSSS